MNVLDVAENSVAAGATLTHITLAADTKRRLLTLTIADTGNGWDVDTGTDRAAWARFAVIRAYAESQGWEFQLVSVVGEGTTVTLSR